ncbi:MAG: hypothetical protein WBB23_09115 [Desulforhopalus sp.]
MNYRTFLICFFLIWLIGCDGPAEQAGENLDAEVAAARNEVADLKREIEDYKQTIKQSREELAASKEQLALAQKEMEETKMSRQEILEKMESVQKEAQAESVPAGQGSSEEQMKSSPPSETLLEKPAEPRNTVQ